LRFLEKSGPLGLLVLKVNMNKTVKRNALVQSFTHIFVVNEVSCADKDEFK
jgi:hypothetical protein